MELGEANWGEREVDTISPEKIQTAGFGKSVSTSQFSY
jgi:hypothetical protein